MSKNKIGFLYINKPYMVYHSIGVAVELAKNENNEVLLFCIKENKPLIDKLLKRFHTTIEVKILYPHWKFKLPTFLEFATLFRLSLFFKYKRELEECDSIVCTAFNDIDLKKQFSKAANTKFVYTEHGIPNREYSFEGSIIKFDLFFVFGQKIKKIRGNLNQLTPYNHVVSGYAKYDLVKKIPTKKLFKDKKTTVLYNPHFRKEFSSFEKFGKQILDFFIHNKNYNLIFAPHSSLFSRSWKNKKWLNNYQYDNILIDTGIGSEDCNDMTYTKYADIYIGDISSQALEFILVKERPCIFLDAHDLKEDKVYRPLSWELGEIVSDIDDFEDSVKRAIERHEQTYKEKQTKMKKEMFYHDPNYTPSQLAAQAIEKLLER